VQNTASAQVLPTKGKSAMPPLFLDATSIYFGKIIMRVSIVMDRALASAYGCVRLGSAVYAAQYSVILCRIFLLMFGANLALQERPDAKK
jgi:hypothetical protein